METKQQIQDTPERIDAFLDALNERNLPARAYAAVRYRCETPANLKAAIDNDFAGRDFYGIGPKTKEKIRAFYEAFEKEHPASDYKELSPDEKFLYKLHREFGFLTDEDFQFIFSHHERTGHYPMFFLISKYYETATDISSQITRDYYGFSGARKTHDEIKSTYKLSEEKTGQALYRAKFDLARKTKHLMDVLDDDWGQYGFIFTKPIVTPDYITLPFQQIAAEEHLTMSRDCFFYLCGRLVGSVWMQEQAGFQWIVKCNGSEKFLYEWMLRDVRTARKKKSIEYFDLDEYCRDPQNWRSGRVVNRAIPTAIKLSEEIVLLELGLQSRGKKIILNSKK